jgi:hypothetical protein
MSGSNPGESTSAAASGKALRVGVSIPVRHLVRLGICGFAVASSIAWGQSSPPPSGIYSCVDANGKKLTSDRPIAECNNINQRVLNADGSVKKILTPTKTADEQADFEAQQRTAAVALANKQEAMRRDRNLLARFPDEATHRKARQEALDPVRKGVKQSEQRLAALAIERKPMNDEAEFYVGKPLPFKLKLQMDANDASVDAQKSLLQNQQLEYARVDSLYDAELERLRLLWQGARPGTLGVIAGAASSPPLRK